MSDEKEKAPVLATARVRLEVEVTLGQPWPTNASIEEVHRTARLDAEERVRVLLQRSPEVVLVGAVDVAAVIVRDRRR